MRSPQDALRSVKRYLALVLGTTWEVRLDTEQGTVHYPYCRVYKIGATTYTGAKNLQDMVMTVGFACYAGPGSTVEVAQNAAEAVEEKLSTGFLDGVDRGAFFRIPLYDYTGVSLSQPATDGANRPSTSDYLRVQTFTVESIAEPDDNRRIAVVGQVRVTWRRATIGRLGPDPGGPTLTSVTVEADSVG